MFSLLTPKVGIVVLGQDPHLTRQETFTPVGPRFFAVTPATHLGEHGEKVWVIGR